MSRLLAISEVKQVTSLAYARIVGGHNLPEPQFYRSENQGPLVEHEMISCGLSVNFLSHFGRGDLTSLTKGEPSVLAVEAHSLNHWTAGGSPMSEY